MSVSLVELIWLVSHTKLGIEFIAGVYSCNLMASVLIEHLNLKIEIYTALVNDNGEIFSALQVELKIPVISFFSLSTLQPPPPDTLVSQVMNSVSLFILAM